ncbi:acyl-CoA synthetase (AMP-forming)/AMP-acid ligase II [Azospirillum agricola]|uniref:class I adenylate-forming enzyme family protein n=1 Tax=Azospirillum agricola TaxID=1720247 RepID=UPI001AE84949|nr:class I adenylate-forming enzyme family protein [Azospirillum agricola]MBP2227743.1 acyl-CoA synthetase (AMP-forming)/AMP-acid ligase II [Azospirillum agricola]
MAWPDGEGFPKRRELLFGTRLVPCYSERPATLDAMLRAAVARAPGNEAVVDGERRFTYRELDALVTRAAGALVARGGGAGDRVALVLTNRAEFLIALLAAARIGLVSVPVSAREQRPGITGILADCGAKFLIHDAALADRMPEEGAVPSLVLRLSVGGAAGGAEPFENLLCEAERTLPEVPRNEEDTAVILYTSGTTGKPKGALLAHVNIIHSAMHFEECWRYRDGERAVLAVPASHVTGLVAVLLAMVRVAGCVILMPAFDANAFLALASRERMTTTVLVPAMYNLVLLRGDVSRHDLTCWRIGGFGGAPMPEATVEAMAERLPDLHLLNAYGSTECATIISVVPVGRTRDGLDTVGMCVPCGDLRIVGEDGRECPAGETGEVWIRGPMTIPGYWNREDATRAGFVDGYWRSGDLGALDARGWLRLFDRKGDVINRGGYKIYSVELENALARHPDVVEVAAVAHPDPVLGEKIHVFVTTASAALTAEDVRVFCRAALAEYKVPDHVTLLREALPRNANGKVTKRVLRDRVMGRVAGA